MFFFSLASIRTKARQTLNQTIGIFTLAAVPVGLSVFVNILAQFRSFPNQYELTNLSYLQVFNLFISNTTFPIVAILLIGLLGISIRFTLVRLVSKQQEVTSYADALSIFNHQHFGKITATYLLRSLLLFIFGLIPIVGLFLVLFGFLFLILTGIFIHSDVNYALFAIIPIFIGLFLFCAGIALYIPFYYSYSLMDMVLYDQLEQQTYKNAWTVLKESSRLMKGYKIQAFQLDFSLIGWHLLTVITFGIAGIYTLPYTGLAHVYFYQELLLDRQQKQLL